MLRWFLRFVRRYALFTVVVIGGARVYSWLFGYDDEVKAWSVDNRLTIVLILVLSAIIYGMYVWLDEEP